MAWFIALVIVPFVLVAIGVFLTAKFGTDRFGER